MITSSTLGLTSSYIFSQSKSKSVDRIKQHFSSNSENKNSYEYLDKNKERLFQNLQALPHAPSVQVQPSFSFILETCLFQMHDRLPDGVTVNESTKGRSEGDPDIR